MWLGAKIKTWMCECQMRRGKPRTKPAYECTSPNNTPILIFILKTTPLGIYFYFKNRLKKKKGFSPTSTGSRDFCYVGTGGQCQVCSGSSYEHVLYIIYWLHLLFACMFLCVVAVCYPLQYAYFLQNAKNCCCNFFSLLYICMNPVSIPVFCTRLFVASIGQGISRPLPKYCKHTCTGIWCVDKVNEVNNHFLIKLPGTSSRKPVEWLRILR